MFAAASVKFSSVVPIEVFPLIPGSVVLERPAAVKGAPGRARRSAPLTARTVPRESEERGKTVTDQPGNNLTRTPRISRPVTTRQCVRLRLTVADLKVDPGFQLKYSWLQHR